MLRRRPVLARALAAPAVALILWAWGAGQYPAMLVPDVTVADAASHRSVLVARLIGLAVGAAFLVPSLWWLYSFFQRSPATGPAGRGGAHGSPPGRPSRGP